MLGLFSMSIDSNERRVVFTKAIDMFSTCDIRIK